MPLKRVGFVLQTLGIYGGVNVLLNWAAILAKSGYHLDLIVPQSCLGARIPFLCEEDARLLHLISHSDARSHRYHAVLATYWPTIAHLADLDADHWAWFMQAYEGQFLDLNVPAQADFDELVASEMNVITIAHWLQQHVLSHYNFEPKRTFCVLNPLDKALWRPVPREPLKGGRPIRFLVEGPANDARKNVPQTIRLLERLGMSYRWVGSLVDRSLVGPNCWGVEEKVPYHRMPEVYGSADVLVKASNSEGMFGPPLEMFATGGTAAVWDVQGSEEYLSDRYNSRVVPMNSWPRLAEAVLELANDRELVRSLQENALATAEAWPTWEDQAERIVATIESLAPLTRSSLIRHLAKNQFRAVLHSQPVELEARRAQAESRRAEAEADRARRAEAELQRLRNSRSWRIANLLQRTRRRLAPDNSRQWAYTERAGQIVWRIGRRLRSFLRAAGWLLPCPDTMEAV